MSLLAGKRILIVDDEPDLRDLISEEFRFNGCLIVEAPDGAAALQIIKTNDIDIVLSDLRMPDMDGILLLEKVRQINPKKPLFFLLTGYPDVEAQEALKKGANGLFLKPMDWRKLVIQIEEIAKKSLS